MAPLTRREIIKNTAILAAGSAIYLGKAAPVFTGTKMEARVVLIRDKNLLDENGQLNKDVLSGMLNQAVCKLLDAKDPLSAWKKLFQPDDKVGIKTNVWRYLSTPKELEDLLSEGIQKAGVLPGNIKADDRGVLEDPFFKQTTALVNVRPLRTHYWSGVGSLIKNYIMFDPNPASYHPDSCADLAKLWQLPLVAGKTRLNILVMITPLFHGVGPHHYNAEYTWKYNGLLLGTDPVAVDSIGVQILQAKRKEYFKEDKPINPPVKHIVLAESRHHLGIADPAKIELIKLGWNENILIG